MSTSSWPAPQDATDEAINQLLEYLAITREVEAELEGIRPAIRRVVLELLIADEAAGRLTPFRQGVLALLRAPRPA